MSMRWMILLSILSLFSFGRWCWAAEPWRFAVLGDTHVGVSDTVAEMIPYLLADDIDFICLPGDIVNGGAGSNAVQLKNELLQWREIFRPLYEAGIGVYPLVGNHENDARNFQKAWDEVFSGSYALPANGPAGEVNRSYSFSHKNALCIGLDCYASIHQVNQEWLDEQLRANTLPHVFVFGHEPAFKVFHGDCLDDLLEARNTFWHSLSNAGVHIYFCGHDHFLDVARIDDGDGNTQNDVIQYVVGTGGGWLMQKYSNYNGDNGPYSPRRLFHEMNFGYALVEISGSDLNDLAVSVIWKERKLTDDGTVEYVLSSHDLHFTVSLPTETGEPERNRLCLYPNPCSYELRISGHRGELCLRNMQGVVVWSGWVESGSRLNTGQFPDGFYVAEAGNNRIKILKKR